METTLYKYLDFNDLEIKALNDRLSYLEQLKNRYDNAIYSYKDNKDWGKDSLDTVKIHLLETENLITQVQKKIKKAEEKKINKNDVIDDGVLKVQNHFYEKRNEKIEKLEAQKNSYNEVMEHMADGKLKDKITKRYKKTSKKLDKKKAKNVKIADKQIARICENEMARDRIEKRVAKLKAEATVYASQGLEAHKAAAIENISNHEKRQYERTEKRYKSKQQKVYRKLEEMANRKNKIKAGNPIRMAKGAVRKISNFVVAQVERHL